MSQDFKDMFHDSGNFVGILIFLQIKKINFDKNYIGFELPKRRSIDIDNLEDFKLAEMLYAGSKKLNNNKIIIGSANFGLNYSHLNSYKK